MKLPAFSNPIFQGRNNRKLSGYPNSLKHFSQGGWAQMDVIVFLKCLHSVNFAYSTAKTRQFFVMPGTVQHMSHSKKETPFTTNSLLWIRDIKCLLFNIEIMTICVPIYDKNKNSILHNKHGINNVTGILTRNSLENKGHI